MTDDLQAKLNLILDSPSYRLAETDTDFLTRPELQPVRMQLELLKPEMAFVEHEINSTIVVFGGTQVVPQEQAAARVAKAKAAVTSESQGTNKQLAICSGPNAFWPNVASTRSTPGFGRLVSSTCQKQGHCDYVIITGGGPGIMEAANRGAYETGRQVDRPEYHPAGRTRSKSLHHTRIVLPIPLFRDSRKCTFCLRAKALVIFPGGFGTLDELFDALTLRQVGRCRRSPSSSLATNTGTT